MQGGMVSKVHRTYLLDSEVAATIRQIADRLNVYDSSLVNLLLRHGLADIAERRLNLRRRPVKWVLEEGQEDEDGH